MVDIKFRAWDKQNRCMVIASSKKMLVIDTTNSLSDSALTDGYELMQFTGKVDCKGVDVYDGDIIKFNGMNIPVIWNSLWCCWELAFSVHSVEEGELQNLDFSDWCDRAYVVGNIYANKELLG